MDVDPTIISQVSNVKRNDHLTFLGVVFLHFLYVVPADSRLKYFEIIKNYDMYHDNFYRRYGTV